MIAKKTVVNEYKKTKPFTTNLAVGNVKAIKIGFSCLYDRLARDFLSMDLSHYTFTELMAAPAPKNGALSSCPNTLGPFDLHFLKITFSAISKDRPLKIAEVEAEFDAFKEKLNGALSINGKAPKEGEIVMASVSP